MLFIVISIAIIIGYTLISHILTHHPESIRPPHSQFHRRPPSRLLMDILMLSICYTLTTFVETFIFAQKKEQESIQSQNENLQTELKLLKSQINPHFLFNALNNIYALSVMDSDKTQESISHLSTMLRYVLYECEQPMVQIQKEVNYIEEYLKLFSLKSSIPFAIEIETDILDSTTKIAPMLFIPFIENALKHSNIEERNASFIKINIYADKHNVRCRVENSIPKRSIQKDKVGGIGLDNVKRRLAIIYPHTHQLEIRKDEESFLVNLNIQRYANN